MPAARVTVRADFTSFSCAPPGAIALAFHSAPPADHERLLRLRPIASPCPPFEVSPNEDICRWNKTVCESIPREKPAAPHSLETSPAVVTHYYFLHSARRLRAVDAARRGGTRLALRRGEMKEKSSIRRTINGRAWRTALLAVALAAAALSGTGCEEDCDLPVVGEFPPAPPSGVYSITGDGWIEIRWNANTETGLAGYDIFWSDDPSAPFDYMVSVPRHATSYVDYDVDNGFTYFYQIRAFDLVGRVSDFSAIIFDTPRPAGTGLILYDYMGQKAALSGYDFSAGRVQAAGDATTDVYFGSPSGRPTLFGKGSSVGDGVDVQDYGLIDLELVDWAPEIYEGWAPSKRVELIQGHSYVVQILDTSDYYFYAKVYCQAVNNDFVVLDWAFQIDPGNPELAPERGGQR